MTGYWHHREYLLVIVGYLLLVPLLVCSQQPKSGGTLRVAWEADAAGMDPRLSPGAQAGYEFQRYVTGSMMTCGVASLPFLQAARTDVKGYVHLHGYKMRFETTWIDRP
jgi:hypothetical protein